MRRLFFPLLLLVMGALVSTAAAQQTVNDASVSGRVTDSQGAVIVGSEVTARQTDTNLMSTVVTDAEGRFRFPYLRVGPYEFAVRAKGFADARRSLTVTVGGAYELAVSLSVGAIETNVTVTGDGTLLEAARTQIAGTVSQAEVKNLPMNGRNFLDLALLVPGVSLTNVGGGTQVFPETSAVPGVGISVGSQRNLSNNFIVDGLSANDDAAALSGISYGVDALDQVQVVTSGGQAELGRALGGYVNLVTRSGTNAFRGDVYSYWRDDSLNAANPLLGATLPMSQQQYGMSVGGPLVRSRTFFFGNVEHRLLDQTGLVTISDANVAAINARLTAVGYPGPLVTTGVYPNPIHTLHGLVKVDHQVSAGDRASVRYSAYDVDAKNARGAGGLNAPTASAGIDNVDQTIAVSNVMSLSPRTVNETRAQIAFSDLDALPTDPIGPAVSIAGVASFGTLSGAPTARRNTMYQIVDSLSYQAGAHAVRAGADVLYNDVTIVFPRAARGAYSFQNLGNFVSGTYNSPGFTQTFAEAAVTQTNPNLGLYVQDEWKAGARLTLNLGLRYDLQFLETIHTDRDNVSPRFGAAWVPFESKRTVVRGSVGRFYDRVPLRALANALLSAGNSTDLANLRQIAVSLSPTQPGAPVFPNILSDVVPAVTLPALTTMDSNLQNAYSNQAGIEIEQQIGPSATMSVGYQHVAGRRLIMSINQNVPTCAVSGTNNGCRPISDYANNSQYSAAGTSVYDALLLSFVQRPARWGTYRVSYVYSKSMNNVGEAFFNAPIDNFDLSKDWGRSDDDQRHRLVVSGAISSPAGPATTVWEHLSHDLQVSGVLRGYSALPFNITSGVNTIQGTPGRPVVDGAFISRNAGELSAFVSMDLRVSRAFAAGPHARIEALLEVFNLLNRQNTLAVNANFGAGAYPASPSPTFRQVTAVADPRTAQIGLRVRF